MSGHNLLDSRHLCHLPTLGAFLHSTKWPRLLRWLPRPRLLLELYGPRSSPLEPRAGLLWEQIALGPKQKPKYLVGTVLWPKALLHNRNSLLLLLLLSVPTLHIQRLLLQAHGPELLPGLVQGQMSGHKSPDQAGTHHLYRLPPSPAAQVMGCPPCRGLLGLHIRIRLVPSPCQATEFLYSTKNNC